jgi:16S rRNA (adenine1518-N6/adenine1519-N6)-dimethyltransferase
MKKSLGQNFLIDHNVIRKIVNIIDIKKKNVIEIGPGRGAITDEIIKKKPNSLLLIEKDDKLFYELQQKFKKNKKVKIFHADILKFNLEKIIKKNSIIFGNLPYNISSQILVKILRLKQWPPNLNDIIFMFQKELAEKIIATYPSPNYGRISILFNYRLYLIKKILVSSNCFYPKPKVNSMVIHLKPKKEIFFKIKEITNLEKVTNTLFSNKRKMINKSIKKILNQKKIQSLTDLKLHLRPTNLKPEIYYKITELFEKN